MEYLLGNHENPLEERGDEGQHGLCTSSDCQHDLDVADKRPLTPVEQHAVDLDHSPQQLVRPPWPIIDPIALLDLLPQNLCAVVRAEEREVRLGEALDLGARLEDGRDPAEEDVRDWRTARERRDGPQWDWVRFLVGGRRRRDGLVAFGQDGDDVLAERGAAPSRAGEVECDKLEAGGEKGESEVGPVDGARRGRGRLERDGGRQDEAQERRDERTSW